MAQPSPAARLGTTTIRSLVIILHMWRSRLSKGCANHSGHSPKVKGNSPKGYRFLSIARFSAFGEREFAAVAQFPGASFSESQVPHGEERASASSDDASHRRANHEAAAFGDETSSFETRPFGPLLRMKFVSPANPSPAPAPPIQTPAIDGGTR